MEKIIIPNKGNYYQELRDQTNADPRGRGLERCLRGPKLVGRGDGSPAVYPVSRAVRAGGCPSLHRRREPRPSLCPARTGARAKPGRPQSRTSAPRLPPDSRGWSASEKNGGGPRPSSRTHLFALVPLSTSLVDFT